MRKGVFGLLISTLAGCSFMYPHADLPPEKAAKEIINAVSPQTHVLVSPPGLGIGATVLNQADLTDITKDLMRYCANTGGVPLYYQAEDNSLFAGNEGFVCRSKSQNLLTFAVSLRAKHNLTVLERRSAVDSSFDQTVIDWGYLSPQQRAELNRQEREKAEAERRELQRIASNKTKSVGDSVCKDQGSIRYQGTVEQVAGDKIKVFVERASFINAPGLRPGGFQQQYHWVNYWDVFGCE